MKIRTVCLALALAASNASALELLTEENPPFNFGFNGQPAGPSTSIVKEMAQRAGIAAQASIHPWQVAYARARDGDNACVYSTARSSERFDLFQWIGPIARGEYAAFARAGFDGKPKRVDDLKAYRIGVANDARAAYLRSRGFTNLQVVDDDRSVPKQLGNGVDLWVTQASQAGEVANAAGITDLKMVFAAILVQEYWLACGKKVPAATVQKLNDAFAGMNKDGTTRRILRGGVF